MAHRSQADGTSESSRWQTPPVRRARLGTALAVLAAMSSVFTPFSGLNPAGASTRNGARDRPPAAPSNLTVDDDAAPLAVTGDPEFGWVVVDRDRGSVQGAYEIRVLDGAKTLVDTHEVRSTQQSYVHVRDLEARLRPDHTYRWTVRTWDASGKAGPYAAAAHFDTGLDDRDWHASWIRRPGAEKQALQDYSLFRKDVAVGASPVVRARVYASAGDHYDLRVNGSLRAHGPSYAYPDEQYYETTDVTADVKAGTTNTFAFVTFWGLPSQGRPPTVPGLIARITIDHADGTRQIITTDGAWRAHTGPWVQDVPRNDEGDFVEHIDERLLPIGWDQPGFDDATWDRAAVIGTHPVQPFTHLFAARTHIVTARVKPVKLTRLADGAYVADFGTVMAATPVVDVRRGLPGRSVTLLGGFLLDPDGHVSTDTRHSRDEHGVALRRAFRRPGVAPVRLSRIPLPRGRRRGGAARTDTACNSTHATRTCPTSTPPRSGLPIPRSTRYGTSHATRRSTTRRNSSSTRRRARRDRSSSTRSTSRRPRWTRSANAT